MQCANTPAINGNLTTSPNIGGASLVTQMVKNLPAMRETTSLNIYIHSAEYMGVFLDFFILPECGVRCLANITIFNNKCTLYPFFSIIRTWPHFKSLFHISSSAS